MYHLELRMSAEVPTMGALYLTKYSAPLTTGGRLQVMHLS